MKPYRIEDHPDYNPDCWWHTYRRKALLALPNREPFYSAGQPLREGGKWRTPGYWGSVEVWLKETIKNIEEIRSGATGELRKEAGEAHGQLTTILSGFIPLARAASARHFEELTKPLAPRVWDEDDWGY